MTENIENSGNYVKRKRNKPLRDAQFKRQIRQSQRRISQIKVFFKLCIIAFITFLIFFILKLPQWRLPSSTFNSLNNPHLYINNNQIVPDTKILSALRRNQVPLQPIFLVNTEYLKESILKLEPIQDVYIRRFWFPARLEITVVERTPIITISPNNEVQPIAFFSADGKLIGKDYMPLDAMYDTVSVLTYGLEDDYRKWDATKVNNLKKIADLIKSETGEKVEYIDYRNPKDVYVKIPTVNIRLGTLNSGIYDKINRLPSLIPQVKMINKKVKYVDLRWDSNYIKLDE
ncbi:MAG: FtsQ-type POTRA domain-containing protein [bacterium]|nr:FtsQ-type POTRA domain-containing protein [bacterium]